MGTRPAPTLFNAIRNPYLTVFGQNPDAPSISFDPSSGETTSYRDLDAFGRPLKQRLTGYAAMATPRKHEGNFGAVKDWVSPTEWKNRLWRTFNPTKAQLYRYQGGPRVEGQNFLHNTVLPFMAPGGKLTELSTKLLNRSPQSAAALSGLIGGGLGLATGAVADRLLPNSNINFTRTLGALGAAGGAFGGYKGSTNLHNNFDTYYADKQRAKQASVLGGNTRMLEEAIRQDPRLSMVEKAQLIQKVRQMPMGTLRSLIAQYGIGGPLIGALAGRLIRNRGFAAPLVGAIIGGMIANRNRPTRMGPVLVR